MRREGLEGVRLDPERGWDHGVFVPLKLVMPEADIPIVQVSVLASEDPEKHLRMGRALASLRTRNIAIVGSGFASFHNLRIMMSLRYADPAAYADVRSTSRDWNDALNHALEGEGEKRWEGLKGWRKLPGADTMHPPRGGEHFMPLIVCTGAAGEEEVTRKYKDEFMGFDIFTYYWGADEVA
jgi:aromatic ring-opening dioxygenase catalytic subunit (LigB family)